MNTTPQTRPTQSRTSRRQRTIAGAIGLGLAAAALAGCSSGSSSGSGAAPAPTGTASSAATPGSPVLPVTSNPIANTSSTQALSIDEVLVENNVDPATGKTASDHLEIAMTNTGKTELTAFEVYYTFDDPKTGDTESYYAELPTSFTIAPGAQRNAHFDNTGEADHFPVNDFSLYYTDTNAIDVTVEVSAADTAVQTATIAKDAGGPETAD
jgi:hypothetical protein